MTEAETAVVDALTGELFDRLASHSLSLRGAAALAGVSPSTISRWQTWGGAVPRCAHFISVGLSVGARLEWVPLDGDWPGLGDPPTSEPPAPRPWWRGQSAGVPVGLQVDGVSAEYLGSLLGAEVRWWRLQSQAFAVEDAPRVNQKTWTAFEAGPRLTRVASQKPRTWWSSPLSTAVAIGTEARLQLVWLPVGASWRVRPWVVAGDPKPLHRTGPLIERRGVVS